MLYRLTLILGLLFYVSGCASQISKQYKFDQSNKKGLVVMGIRSESGPYSLRFTEINPIDCHSANWAGIGDKKFDRSLKNNATLPHYIIDTFDPGTWVIGSAVYNTGYLSTLIVSFERGTVAFEVNAGEFIYIGDVAISRSGSRFLGFNNEKLEEFLTEFSNISAEPTQSTPNITTYKFGADEGEVIQGCQITPDEEEATR